MATQKKWITKKEIDKLLKSYSVRSNEFEPIGNKGCSFKSNYTKGYVISLEQEIQHGSEKTGRILVSHTRGNGKRTYCDIWERDSEGELQFIFRNPWNKPFADYDYIHDLESQIKELEKYGQEMKKLIEQRGVESVPEEVELQDDIYLEVAALKSENEALHGRIESLEKENQKLINETKHNARGAGRKANTQHLEAQVQEVRDLLQSGKSPAEVQKIMGISRSSFFRYKKFIKNTD